MPSTSPFAPSFGVSPPLLVGRQALLDNVEEALITGPGAPGRVTLFTGGRGTGKTVLLNEVERLARSHGWLTIAETATTGLVARLTDVEIPRMAQHLTDNGGAHLTAVGAFGASLAWARGPEPVADLRSRLTDLTDVLSDAGTGLLVTVDELHHAALDELRPLTTVLQHLRREERPIAFVGAGLPHAVDSVLAADPLTFLQRADRHHLGSVSLLDVEAALGEPIAGGGRSIDPADLTRAVDATAGYPFLIQLVGHNMWRQHPDTSHISAADVTEGIIAARRRIGSLVIEPSLSSLSDVERTFLVAMAQDVGPSRMRDIASRLGVDANYASQYRLRLIATDLIEPVGHGLVDFALPGLEDHLREHATHEALGNLDA